MVLAFYWLCRLAFIALYPSLFSELTLSGWFSFVVLSLRFDASTIASISLIFWLLLILPFPKGRIFFRTVRFLFVGLHGIFLLLNAIDVPFFAFNTRRTSWPSLKFLMSDSLRQIPQLAMNYWPLVFLFLGGLVVLYRSFPKEPAKQKPAYISSFFQVLVWVSVGIVLVRNSFQLKPMLPGEAFTLPQTEAGHAVLNTPFLIFKTLETHTLPDQKWLPERVLESLFPKPEIAAPKLKGYNLVILVLESFSTEYTGLEAGRPGYTPFLDSLAKEGTWFPHHFANGRTSRDALPSILASVPAWMDEAFAASPYVSVQLEGIGKSLKKEGYQTAFFHGGKNGTMSFDLFSRIAGFDRYYGLNEYPNPADFDGNWGIFDEPFLQFVDEKLSTLKPPFAAGVFTLSSHQPYTLPDKYQGKFRKGPLPIHEAIGYSDFALRRFFETAKTKPWYPKTLFVLTADHTQASIDPAFSGFAGAYDVPLILFCPSQKIVADTSRRVQHLDIAPGIADLLGSRQGKHNWLGTSLFSKGNSYPIEYQDGSYHLIHPEGLLMWKGEHPNRDWAWMTSRGNTEPAGLRKVLMSRLQYYRQGLLYNRLFR